VIDAFRSRQPDDAAIVRSLSEHSGDGGFWPGDTSGSVLAALRNEFPGYRISRELFVGQVHYIACRLQPGTHPHTVITADPDKLRAALRAGQA
jgi:hypothetical protein